MSKGKIYDHQLCKAKENSRNQSESGLEEAKFIDMIKTYELSIS
jgi:hypothetical protein